MFLYFYNYSTWHKQQYALGLRKFVLTNLPRAGIELSSLGHATN